MPVFAVLGFIIALFALYTPLVTPWGAPNASTGGNDYAVDLGYQLNQGEAVVVWLIQYVSHTKKTNLLSLLETYAMLPRPLGHCAFLRPLHLESIGPGFRMLAMSFALKHIRSGLLLVQ